MRGCGLEPCCGAARFDVNNARETCRDHQRVYPSGRYPSCVLTLRARDRRRSRPSGESGVPRPTRRLSLKAIRSPRPPGQVSHEHDKAKHRPEELTFFSYLRDLLAQLRLAPVDFQEPLSCGFQPKVLPPRASPKSGRRSLRGLSQPSLPGDRPQCRDIGRRPRARKSERRSKLGGRPLWPSGPSSCERRPCQLARTLQHTTTWTSRGVRTRTTLSSTSKPPTVRKAPSSYERRWRSTCFPGF